MNQWERTLLEVLAVLLERWTALDGEFVKMRGSAGRADEDDDVEDVEDVVEFWCRWLSTVDGIPSRMSWKFFTKKRWKWEKKEWENDKVQKCN